MAGRIAQLLELGQSPWLDFIRRGNLLSGEFERTLRRGVVGVTSNPTIFQQALAEGDDYDAALRRLVPLGLEATALFDAIAIEDIRMACDRLAPAFESSGGQDGRVSIEVNPRLAHDTRATIDEALRLHREVARPNVMVKIPATAEGLPAITAATAAGVCVNVTLIFSLARYRQVIDAFLAGLERRAAEGAAIGGIHSVASFFVSRVDSKIDGAIDRVLEGLPAGDRRRGTLESLRGRAAIANARLAYRLFRETFAADRFRALAAAGAHAQRPLWASTSTKDPAYRDVRYVEELIAPDTVNTMPPHTLEAFDDHGEVEVRIDRDLEAAETLFARLAEHGIDAERLIGELEGEGVASFAKSYDQLLQTLDRKRRALHDDRWVRLELPSGEAQTAIRARLEHLEDERFGRRLWDRDPTLWSADPKHQEVARRRLGWLDAPDAMKRHLPELREFAREVARAGYGRAVLLGMGGSSLAPEVLRRTFGVAGGALDLTVLDSTSPAAVRAVQESHDPRRTLFVVSSKSGTTVEVTCLERHFHAWVAAAAGRDAGRSFVAITDPGSPLEALARERGYRRTFLNAPDIGGRYSALSCFGLVPAALIGAPLEALIEHALDEARASGPDVAPSRSLGIQIGAALGELARQGRDKLTLVIGPELAALGAWVEQLVAESTGKEGRGIVPVVDEPLGPPEVYGDDRVFVVLGVDPPRREIDAALAALERAGHPVLRWRDPEAAALGAEFVRWEIATVTAGALLGVDPFDEPNVTEAKEATRAVLEGARDGRLTRPRPGTVEAPARIAEALRPALDGRSDPASWVRAFLGLARPGDYVAALAYFHPTPERQRALQRLATAVRGATRLAATLGIGPRFLHSTGQLHKGGPNSGMFLQFTADHGEDVPIPGEGHGFATLIEAQSLGDYRVLDERGRRVLRVHLGSRPETTLDEIAEAVAAAHV